VIIDFKYHIASLVAVFLALGIGILIGSTMLGSNSIVETQKQLTNNLNQQMQVLREQNKAVEMRSNNLETNNHILNEFGENVLPVLVENRLLGQKIAIIQTNNLALPNNLKTVLQTAGAKINSVTNIMDDFDISDDKLLPDTLNITPDEDRHNIVQSLSQAVAQGILLGQNTDVINSLVEKGFIKIEGTYGLPVNAVIIIGGSKDNQTVKLADIDFPIIKYFSDSNINIYGVEESDIVYSYMKDYQKKNITTVDNINTIPGQLALVLAMQGRPGNYGIKETAKSLLPPLGVAENAAK
jgi:hypothetical protein